MAECGRLPAQAWKKITTKTAKPAAPLNRGWENAWPFRGYSSAQRPGSEARKAVPAVIGLLKANDWFVRGEAA